MRKKNLEKYFLKNFFKKILFIFFGLLDVIKWRKAVDNVNTQVLIIIGQFKNERLNPTISEGLPAALFSPLRSKIISGIFQSIRRRDPLHNFLIFKMNTLTARYPLQDIFFLLLSLVWNWRHG